MITPSPGRSCVGMLYSNIYILRSMFTVTASGILVLYFSCIHLYTKIMYRTVRWQYRISQIAQIFGLAPRLILAMGSANERRRYSVTSSLIGLAHSQNDPCGLSRFEPPTAHTVELLLLVCRRPTVLPNEPPSLRQVERFAVS